MNTAEPKSPEGDQIDSLDNERVVKHTRLGIWDHYEEKDPDAGRLAIGDSFRAARETLAILPYALRAVQDILAIPECKLQVAVFTASEFADAIIPAISVWLEGQLLRTMEVAIETGEVDAQRVFLMCAGRIACTFSMKVLSKVRDNASKNINKRLLRAQALRSFRTMAILDVPTSEQPEIQQEIRNHAHGDVFGMSSLWSGVYSTLNIVSTSVRLGAESFILWNVVKGHAKSAVLLAAVPFLSQVVSIFRMVGWRSSQTAWAMTTRNVDYLKVQGWKRAVQGGSHRQEIVAGDLATFAITEYTEASDRLGDNYAGIHHVHRMVIEAQTSWKSMMTNSIFANLPQIAFSIYAAQNRGHFSEFVSSFHLVQSTATSVSQNLGGLVGNTQRLGEVLQGLRSMYTENEIQNIVRDGSVSFPADPEDISAGISLEFRNVSFKYPRSDKYALRNVSFKLLPGQLCVIVGSNGAGKSTILKLAVRLYDPDEGEISLGGHDVRTLKLSDLRRAISVLFQDYTHFPFSIRDNIALGDPANAHDDERVRLAAQLGGADKFIEKLEDGYNTHITSPSTGFGSGPSTGSKTRSGKVFDQTAVWKAAGMKDLRRTQLSGGQMQRLAVARTFMRSLIREDVRVGLLLFDEPSASLDPIAEHELFDRLRELRGNKTMVFSSHRFGKLTRHADLILYMDDSGVVESGKHDELLQREGEYARLWMIQAQAFVS